MRKLAALIAGNRWLSVHGPGIRDVAIDSAGRRTHPVTAGSQPLKRRRKPHDGTRRLMHASVHVELVFAHDR